MKRFFDIFFSLLAVIVLSPILIPVMIILKLTGEHYIFYKQKRIGYKEKEFDLLKFATMLNDSPNLLTGDITIANDPRVLPFGKFLRKSKINELPQLFNILAGDMSIIGPRPLTKKNFLYYSDDVRAKISNLVPGLSGIGSIVFRDEESLYKNKHVDFTEFYKNVIAPYKGSLEIWFMEHDNLFVYFTIIFLTVWVILFPQSQLPYSIFKDLPEKPQILKGAQK